MSGSEMKVDFGDKGNSGSEFGSCLVSMSVDEARGKTGPALLVSMELEVSCVLGNWACTTPPLELEPRRT